MRVGLIHNAEAGDAGELTELLAAVARHGHDVAIVGAPAHGVEHLLTRGLEAIAAAGGDGTIATVALALRGSAVPLAVLPMGTANNIAASLGVPRDLDEALALWTVSTPRAFDLGVATSSVWGERRFVESIGGGLVTHGIAVMDRQHLTSPTTAEQLQRALQSHLDVLEMQTPVFWTGTVDGAPIDGEYLLLEVLNTAAIGPNLAFAPGATPHDGQFTVVAAGPNDRPAVAAYLRALAAGERPAALSLQTWTGTDIVISASDRLHIDDDIVGEPGNGPATVRIAMDRGAVQVLAPPAVSDRSAVAVIDTMTGWTPAQTLLAPYAKDPCQRGQTPNRRTPSGWLLRLLAARRRDHGHRGHGQGGQVARVEWRAGGAGGSRVAGHGQSLW